ncbi:peroxiredoxin [Agromyces protaetiae]|uniref:Peroxiredoxin n=1 Tax=Agromyces protaetiae TaxID=2509455 RepID=A0A4P6FHS9_9MICO|nr:peroxiredoxin [Agromyces protaetiae]QAY74099.1 peroxiredoxin [Agromyces protaetiae]
MILQPGAVAPDFALVDQFGALRKLSELHAERPVALVFFPLAFSGICHGELCELRDNIAIFDDASVQLVGISVDSKHTLRAWAAEQHYDFPLLSDFWPHGAVAQSFGAFREDAGAAARATFLIGTDGLVKASFASAPGEPRPLSAYREALAAVA